MFPTVLIILGILSIAAFAHVNFTLQPRWYPDGRPSTALGVLETILFLGGLTLVSAGCTIIGTAIGYASF